MKIAVIGVNEIPSNQGEIERYCQEFYPRIAARGHQVDLFVRSEPNRQSWFSVSYYYKVRIIALSTLPKHKNGLMFNSALSTVWASLGTYDVIHIHGTKPAWFSWFPQLFSSSKVIVTSHQLDTNYSSAGWLKAFRWLSSLIERTAVKNADELVVVSKPLGEYFQRKYGIYPRYIPNAPASHDRTNSNFDYGTSLGLEQNKYILCLGRLSAENKLDLLLKAFQKIKHDSWKLVLAGEIGNSIQYAVELLGLAKDNRHIIFTNEIKGEHLSEVVKNAGLLVIPADGTNLGLPLTVLEAMQHKVPVLANDEKIYRGLIGENRGLLFESGNLDSLTERLQYAVSEPFKLATMVQNAQTYITINHNWDRITYGNLSLYLKTTEKLGSPDLQHNI